MPTHRENLKVVNAAVLPKFLSMDQLKSNLEKESDPVVKDEIQSKILGLRNSIIEDVIAVLQDMLDARASGWRRSLCDDMMQTSRVPKWYAGLKPDAIMSYIHENLLEAVERYNPHKVPFCKFTSFFWTHNENMLKNRLKKLHVDKADVSMTFPLDVIDSDKGSSGDEVERSAKPYQDSRKCRGHRKLHPNLMISEEVAENQIGTNIILKQILKKVTSRKEKHIIRRLLLGYNQTEIAERMGYSGTNISTTLKNLAARCAELAY